MDVNTETTPAPHPHTIRFGVVSRLGYLWCLTCAERLPAGRVVAPPSAPGPDGERAIDTGDEATDAVVCGRLLESDREVYADATGAARCDQCGHDLGAACDEIRRRYDAEQLAAAPGRSGRFATHETVGGATFRAPAGLRVF